MGSFDQRPRFFEGQYLSADDLSAVIDYLRGSDARQALGSHTWGIGIGLNLVERPAPGAANRREVVLQPGWARDGFARNLVVQQPARLAETLFAAIPYNAAIDSPAAPGGAVGRLVKVWLSYTETGGAAPAPGFELCGSADSNSRVAEGYGFAIGELALADQRDPVVIGAETLDAADALVRFDATAPPLFDASVPHQAFPAGDKPPRWLVPIGLVRWVAGQGMTSGYFVDRALVPTANVAEAMRAFRRYAGTVTENIEASDGAIVMRRRSDDPGAPHRFAQELTSGQPLATLLQDLVWVEGGLRIEGDAKLAGSRLLLRNADGATEGNELYLARYGDGSGLPGRRELRAVIGTDAQADNRFVVGPETAAPPPPGVTPPQQAPRLVVVSSGRVGVNVYDPAACLHARGEAILLDDAAGAKRIAMRTDGAAVDLRSDTHSLYLRAAGPAATNGNRVIINPFKGTDGAVGIGTDDPQFGLDVQEPAVRFKLDGGNGGSLVLRSDAAAAARDKVYLEASNAAGNAASPEVRITAPFGANVPLFSAYADTVYVSGRLGVNQPAPDAATQVHVRGPRIRLQSADGARVVDLRTDGSAVDLQSVTCDLYLRSTDPTLVAPRNIVMNPFPGDGNVGVGTGAPVQKLHVAGSYVRVDGAGLEQAYLGGDGSVTFDGAIPTRDVKVGSFDPAVRLVQAWNLGSNSAMDLLCNHVLTASDAALKQDLKPLQGSLGKVGRLHGMSYRLRDDPRQRDEIGFIAQEVEREVPQAVVRTAHGLAIDYTRLVPLLVEAVKELQQQVQALQARVDASVAPVAAPAAAKSARRTGKGRSA